MAINPETQYPGKIAPSTPDYPYGAARNITVPGDGTGTPWEAALVNDLFGFQQALLDSANITPSGTPDKVSASQYLEALRKTTVQTFESVEAMVNGVAKLKTGAVVETISYYAGWAATAGRPTGGNLYELVDAGSPGARPAEDGGAFIHAAGGSGGLYFKGLFVDGLYDMRRWGLLANNVFDGTTQGQAAMDYVSSLGGGVVLMPEGTILISNTTSPHPNAAWLIPSNIYLLGKGEDVTTITRPSAERGDDGVLLVNKNYDTNGMYTADGNIVIDGFTITDGAATPIRALGDLIGIGHCDGFRARNIKGGNHDQHLFDICSSKNVVIESSCEGSNVVADISASTVQIDGSDSLGIWGLLLDGTPTTDIKVRGKYKNTGALRTIDLFHANNTDYENIDIDCEVDGAYTTGGQCIGIDDAKTDINVAGLKVRGTYKTNNSDSTAVRLLLNPGLGKKVDQVDVDVDVSGNGRGGVLVGVGTAGVAGRWGTVRSKVKARIITDYTDASTEVYGVQYTGIDNLFMSPEDDVSIVKASITGVSTMAAALIQDCKGDSDGGRYVVQLSDGGANKYVSPVIARHFFSVIRDFDFRMKKPILEVFNGCGHHFVGDDNATWGLKDADNFLLSEAKFIGNAQISNILEPVKLSDGTNGWRQVQLDGSTDGEFAITPGQFYTNRNMGMKKTGAAAELVKIDLIYAPNAGTLDTDAEDIQFAYIGAANCAGTQIVDINPGNGTFSILTGNDGVSAVINNATFQPVIRTAGVIKAWVGI